MKEEATKGRANIVVMGVLVVLGAGLAAWWQSTRGPASHDPAPVLPPEAIERALAQVEADSLALKTKWVESVPDIDEAAFDAGQRETFVRFVNARFCECGCGYTLGACRNFDPTCEFSGPLVGALVDSIQAGHPFAVDGLRPRPDAKR